MTKLSVKPWIKLLGSACLVLAVLLTAFHFWFRTHAEEVIEELVDARSNGKVNLKLKKFRFNYFSRSMELQNALFYTPDSLNAPSFYRFRVARLRLELHSFWDLVLRGKLSIDSLALIRPDIEAVRLRPADSTQGSEVSIPREMGRIYHSINEGLAILGVQQFRIQEGRFSIQNRMEPGRLPVVITHIDFLIDNREPDSSGIAAPDKYLYSDNLVLRTHHQQIRLPDGRHQIAFRQFRINIRRQQIEMDSCTISAEKTDSTRAAFTVFFDTLRLTNVDFQSLYRTSLIKADSVACTRPDIRLWIGLRSRPRRGSPLPTIRQLIQPLTGDLQLGYVRIADAALNIVASRNEHQTSISSRHDYMEMADLRVRGDPRAPLHLKSFAIAIRDYETISRDSTLSFRFDSVKFSHDRVQLSNFSVQTLHGKRPVDIERNYRVPRFELENLSWDELLFNRNIKASRAILYQPVMTYRRLRPRPSGQKLTLFRALGTIDNLMELRQLEVLDGQLNFQLDRRTQVALEHANILVSSNALLKSRSISSLQQSFDRLQFGHGTILLNDLHAEMKNVRFTGQDQQLAADELIVRDSANLVTATARDVFMNELYYNDSTRRISVEGLQWNQATIHLSGFPRPRQPSRTSISLRDVRGENSQFILEDSTQSLSAFFRQFTMERVLKPAGQRTTVAGFRSEGGPLRLERGSLRVGVGEFAIADGQPSRLSRVDLQADGPALRMKAAAGRISWTPALQDLFSGNLNLGQIRIDQPEITVSIQPGDSTRRVIPRLPDLSIDRILLTSPVVSVRRQSRDGYLQFSFPAAGPADSSDQWMITGIGTSRASASFSLGGLHLRSSGFALQAPSGRLRQVSGGPVLLEAARILANRPDSVSRWTLSGDLEDLRLQDITPLTTGRQGVLQIEAMRLGGMHFTADRNGDLAYLLENNPGFVLGPVRGTWSDSVSRLLWYGLTYHQQSGSLSLDSFSLAPRVNRQARINSYPYQVDDIRVQAEATRLGRFNLAGYLRHNRLQAGSLVIRHPVILAYRDTRKPFQGGKIKWLPTRLLQQWSQAVSLDTLELLDGRVTYTQFYGARPVAGTLPIEQLQATLTHIRNTSLHPSDSLQLTAEGRILAGLPVRLDARESYGDSLAGIRLRIRMPAADLRQINPLLEPAVSAKIRSGYLDSLYLEALADEYVAVGVLRMPFHHLYLSLLKGRDTTGRAARSRGFRSFLVNTFLLRQRNDSRPASIYFERYRERSFFNYLAKITLNGIGHATGLKHASRKTRRLAHAYSRKNRPAGLEGPAPVHGLQ